MGGDNYRRIKGTALALLAAASVAGCSSGESHDLELIHRPELTESGLPLRVPYLRLPDGSELSVSVGTLEEGCEIELAQPVSGELSLDPPDDHILQLHVITQGCGSDEYYEQVYFDGYMAGLSNGRKDR